MGLARLGPRDHVLGLDTTGGPSWKPLTVALLVPVAPLGRSTARCPRPLAVVARAGGLLALALAFRLARRLAGRSRRDPGRGVAAVALALTPGWFHSRRSNEAPLAVAFMLWAIERHLDRRRDYALVLGALACLLRPELFPFQWRRRCSSGAPSRPAARWSRG